MICTDPNDKFLKEKTIWIAELSDGSTVFQDDDRPNAKPASAWRRLQAHVEDNGLYISKLSIRSRDHTEEIPEAAQYHFSKSIGCLVGAEEEHHYIISLLYSEGLERRWYKMPEVFFSQKTFVTDVDRYRNHMIKGNLNG